MISKFTYSPIYQPKAQIYNEISDYEALAAALVELLKKKDAILEGL